MSWQLQHGATIAHVQNPLVRDSLLQERAQVLSRGSDGTVYVYNRGLSRSEIRVRWDGLREAEKAGIEAIFNAADGMANTWSLTDHYGNEWTARFLEPELSWVVAGDVKDADTPFEAGGDTFPSTSRKDPAYALAVTLEVSPA